MPHKDLSVRAAYLREYKRRNRHRYAARQRAIDSAKHANERAAKYGAPGLLTIDEAAAIFEPGQCHYCESTSLLGIDHVVPLHAGGLNRPQNLVLSCRACNSSKWRQEEPWRWSRRHATCLDCESTARPHKSYGYCTKCYARRSWYVRRGVARWPTRT